MTVSGRPYGRSHDRTEGEDTAQRTPGGSQSEETRADRFFRQLAADDSPETVEAVRALFANKAAAGPVVTVSRETWAGFVGLASSGQDV